MRLPSPRRTRRLRREHLALARVGADALNDWRASAPDQPLRLNHAKLAQIDLRAANLAGAHLAGADLSQADLSGADLTDANLRNASLRHANLQDVRGLTPIQLAGCDLTGAILPESIDAAALADSASLGESANYTRHLFMWMAGMCAFCLLTLASMPCCQLLTNDGVVQLPVFNASISTSLFFFATPALLIAAFYYFHICLQRLWERLADLPAVFPDGQPLDRKTHGWIMLSLAARRPHRMGQRRAMFGTQTVLNLVLAYLMVPATVFAIWWRYAFRHDWDRSMLHALAVAGTVHLAVGCYAAATGAFRGKKRRLLLWSRHGLAVGLLFLLQAVMKDSFEGEGLKLFNVHIFRENVSQGPDGWNAERLAVWRNYRETLAKRPLATGGVSTAEPSRALDAYLTDYERAYSQVRGAQLLSVNLAGAHLSDSNFAGADMTYVDLCYAQLWEMDLSRAELSGAQLFGAGVYSSWMVGASLPSANLGNSQLYAVIALDADFTDASLRGAVADQFADFRRANFTKANLSGVRFELARLAGAVLKDADLVGGAFDAADLEGASLVGADLRGASFKKASLKAVDFTGAKFGSLPGLVAADPRGVNLIGADLTGAKGLTREQLALALTDETTQLPEYLVDKPTSAPAAAPAPAAQEPVTPLVAEVTPVAETGLSERPHQEVAEQVNPLRRR